MTRRSNTPLRQRAASPSVRDRERGTPAATSVGLSPRDREETNRRVSTGSRENGTSVRSSTPLRERPESRERGVTNGTSARSGTPSRGVRTDGTTARSSSPWSSTERESTGHRGWKY